MEERHNGIISFWKFMFSILILLHHFAQTTQWKYFQIGYLGVEFFFIVSGFLMAKKALKMENIEDKEIGKNTWKYIWKKIKSFFPYILIAYIISIFVKSSFRDFHTYQYVRSIWNLLLIDMSGIVTTYMLGQTWYISAMLISILILFPLILKYKKNFIYLIAPIIVLFVGGYVSHMYGNLENVWNWTGIAFTGLLRAVFEISLGAILYEITEKLKKINFSKIGRILLTLTEIIGFILVFVIATMQSKNYDFIALGLMAISITIAFSEKSILYQFANNKFCYYLEKLSLPIYLNHIWIKDIVVNFTNWSMIIKLISTIILSIIVSAIMLFIVGKLKNKIVNFTKKVLLENC